MLPENKNYYMWNYSEIKSTGKKNHVLGSRLVEN